ncbi:galectin-4 [Pteropus vampyrus]|uniref:Galectin n=1 Tax=Pteropus vampyrus TaxID=132908 RepID=A0A6P6D259_PTEVA|nr:galectin-4 [Pteropus vampyrus]
MAYIPAPGYQPAYNPTLPYNKPIPGGLSIGMSVYIQGVASEHMKRFAVNFTVGQGPEADIAFHFNPRFDGWDKVVFNTKQDGKWGSEEKKRSMPFRKGAAFELVVMVLAEHYKVVVNGNPFYEYGHRLPLQMVTHLQVDGDLELQSINFIGGQPPASQTPMAIPAYPGPGHSCHAPPSNLPTMEGPPTFNPVSQWQGSGIPGSGTQSKYGASTLPQAGLYSPTRTQEDQSDSRTAVVGDAEYHHFRYRIPPERVRAVEVGGDLQLDALKIF